MDATTNLNCGFLSLGVSQEFLTEVGAKVCHVEEKPPRVYSILSFKTSCECSLVIDRLLIEATADRIYPNSLLALTTTSCLEQKHYYNGALSVIGGKTGQVFSLMSFVIN